MAKDKRADLKEIKKQINSSSLTFASEDELFNILGLMKGSVTPLGLINDKNHCVTLLIDDDITSKEKIGIHANTNTSTIWLSFENLIEIINHLGNPTKIINI